jgi:hypothetical protein
VPRATPGDVRPKRVQLVVANRHGCPYRHEPSPEEYGCGPPGPIPECRHPKWAERGGKPASAWCDGDKGLPFPRGCPLRDGDEVER